MARFPADDAMIGALIAGHARQDFALRFRA
jgi:hypothetical protein